MVPHVMIVRGYALFPFVVGLLLSSCGPPKATAPSKDQAASKATCRIQIAPRQAALESAPPSPVTKESPTKARSSRLIAHVELKLASLTRELEAKIGMRLAEERNQAIGIAGHLNYTVDRGPFSASVEGDALVVKTDIRAHAEACRGGGGCYASCEPQGRATAMVPLRLTPEYRFAPSHVTFAFTRGCQVKALGGIVTIDVTEAIQAQINPSLRRVEKEIDGKLPPLRPEAERLWTELGKTRSIPLGGCVITNPRGIVEGPVTGTQDALRVRFGLIAYPEIRSRCGDAAAAAAAATQASSSLPPLAQDPAMPPEDDLVLALVSPLSTAGSALEGSDPFDAGGGAQTRIKRATATPAGLLAQLDLGLSGDVCGDVGVRSLLAWSSDGRSLELASPTLIAGERERVTAASLAPEVLVRSLATVRFAPAVPPAALKELVPSIASSMSDPSVDVSAKVSDVKPLEVVLRGDDLSASVVVRGSVELKQR